MDAPDARDMPPVVGEIAFDHVSFHYVPGVDVLNDVNLHIRPGENVAVVGSTGAGKTTLVTLLHRFADVTQGRITIDGLDIRDVKRQSLVHQMSMVLQEPYLFSGTIEDNIRYAHTGVSDGTSSPRPKPSVHTTLSWRLARAMRPLWPSAASI